jgi:exopolysaccharide biosynthesis polyprenyl glycosylphosphotransferase
LFERRSALLGFIARLHDLGVTVVAFLLAYWIRANVLTNLLGPGWVSPEIYPLSHYALLLLLIVIVWFVTGHLLGIYRDIELRNRRELGTDAAKLVALSVLLLNTILYLIRAEDVSRAFVLTIGGVDLILLMVGRWTLVWGGSWWRDKVRAHHHCLIVGTGPAARELAKLVEQSEPFGLRLIGFVAVGDPPKEPPAGVRSGYPIFTLDQAHDILKNHVVDELLCAVGPDDLDRLAPLIGHCQEEGIRTRVDLGFLPQTFPRVHLENLRHVPLLTLGSAPNDEVALLAKRVADVVLSAFLLIVLSPVMLVVAILIRLTSAGTVLYRQTRCGLNGRRFTLYKFRSMVEGAEAMRPTLEALNEMDGAAFKISADPRCTPVGRWLRKFSLDELPQLWNILRGDMSFVGPRPPLPEEVERYQPWQRRRLRMRPGLTCLWTLEGRNRLLQFDRLVQFDLAYIDNWSLWLDLKIFLKTIPRVALGRGAS